VQLIYLMLRALLSMLLAAFFSSKEIAPDLNSNPLKKPKTDP
jgi:hypothetical protein